jgi:radical SAM superfamily enzyme YgiQ (UPF0313 family)
MKVLLVCPPARDASVLPLGAAYIAGYLQREGHSVEVLDLIVNSFSEEELEAKIKTFGKYDCIGISAIVTSYKFLKGFTKKIKSYFPHLPIIVGNAISIACPRTLLEHSDVDIVVVDEGELTAAELVRYIYEPAKFSNIKGIWYKENNRIYQTSPRERIENLDLLPYPAWDLFEVKVYMQNSGAYLEHGLNTGWISAVRGCPFRCGYCSRGFGQKVTTRSADSVIDEILELKRKFKINHIDMVDDLFMASKRFIQEFCTKLLERKIKISWSCAGRVNLVDEELLRLMKEAGCLTVAYGIESGSQKILNNMNKSATVEQAERAIALVRKVGLKLGGTPYMFGYVGEDLNTIKETIDFIQKMKLVNRKFFFSTPYPNTPLYDWAKKNDRIKYDEDAYLSLLGNNAETFLVNLTDFPDEELLKLKNGSEYLLVKEMPLSVRISALTARKNYIKARMKSLGFSGSLKKILGKIINKANHKYNKNS